MSWEFKPGMKVVCVDDKPRTPHEYTPWKLSVGDIYVIRDVKMCAFRNAEYLGVYLDGVQVFSKANGLEYGFGTWRFRPLQEKKTSIEIFRRIAQGVSDGKPIIDDPMPRKKILEEARL